MIKDSYSDFCDSDIISNQYKVDFNLIIFFAKCINMNEHEVRSRNQFNLVNCIIEMPIAMDIC